MDKDDVISIKDVICLIENDTYTPQEGAVPLNNFSCTSAVPRMGQNSLN
jgi:hypothetical protein